MVETENIQPTEPRSQASSSPQRTSGAKQKREVSFRHSRRILLARRLLPPILGTIFLVMFILVSREFTNRREHLNAVKDLREHFETFKKEHGRVPSQTEVSRFELSSRIKAEGIAYEIDLIHDDSPDNSPLAFTRLLSLRFFPSGHAVLEKSGEVNWLTSAELAERMKRRDQHHARSRDRSIRKYLRDKGK